MINNNQINTYAIDLNDNHFEGMDSIGIDTEDPLIPFNKIRTDVYFKPFETTYA